MFEENIVLSGPSARIAAVDRQRMREASAAAIVFASILLLLGGIAWHYDAIIYWLPLVNSAALLAMLPDSEAARPRSILAGHAITAATGGAVSLLFAGSIVAAVGAVVAGVFLMMLARSPHPPAAITALVLVLNPVSTPWHLPLLMTGAVALSGLATAIRRAQRVRLRAYSRARYPHNQRNADIDR